MVLSGAVFSCQLSLAGVDDAGSPGLAQVGRGRRTASGDNGNGAIWQPK
jgi:hypothetical protein